MTLQQMYQEVSARVNEPTPAFYPVTEIISAINEGQRLFCLLTLFLERTSTWNIAPATPFAHMLPVLPDWIAPLRLQDGAGKKIRPARLDDLTSLDSAWPQTPGAPLRYSWTGADLVGIYPQPTATTAVSFTYARGPVTLVNDGDVPEIQGQYHASLVSYAINRVRQVEGGTELQKTMPLLAEYLDAAESCAGYVRARNRGAQYDVTPFELRLFDRSQLLNLRADLVPRRPPVPVE